VAKAAIVTQSGRDSGGFMRILKNPFWPPVCGNGPAHGGLMMKRSTLLGIFLRSLTIQVSFNFWRMQNLGFAFAMLPMIRQQDGDRMRIAASLANHLQMFNTHPYLVAPRKKGAHRRRWI
jgi:hypothetical protein